MCVRQLVCMWGRSYLTLPAARSGLPLKIQKPMPSFTHKENIINALIDSKGRSLG